MTGSITTIPPTTPPEVPTDGADNPYPQWPTTVVDNKPQNDTNSTVLVDGQNHSTDPDHPDFRDQNGQIWRWDPNGKQHGYVPEVNAPGKPPTADEIQKLPKLNPNDTNPNADRIDSNGNVWTFDSDSQYDIGGYRNMGKPNANQIAGFGPADKNDPNGDRVDPAGNIWTKDGKNWAICGNTHYSKTYYNDRDYETINGGGGSSKPHKHDFFTTPPSLQLGTDGNPPSTIPG